MEGSLNPQLKNQLLTVISLGEGAPGVSLSSRSLAITPYGIGNLSRRVGKLETDMLDCTKSWLGPLFLIVALSSPPS